MIDPLGLRGYSVLWALDPLLPEPTPYGSAYDGPLDPDPEYPSRSPYDVLLPAPLARLLTPKPGVIEKIYARQRYLSMSC